MSTTLSEMLWLFVFCSVSGWMLEFIYRSWKAKKAINPGFLKGPYLPIYGIGAVLIVLCRNQLQETHFLLKVIVYFSTITGWEFAHLSEAYLQSINFVIKCFVYLSVTTGLEFFTGFIFEGYFCIRLWDYTKSRFRLKNYVCLTYSIYWLILALCFEYFFMPLSIWIFHRVDTTFSIFFIVVLSQFMFIDVTSRMTRIFSRGYSINSDVDYRDRLAEFTEIIKPLCEHPDVARLADYKHHRDTSRLEHSIEVAWLSYLTAKKMSLDCRATVRGAILHDLFFYDWLCEGPRLHGFRHPKISLTNAQKVTSLSSKEIDIIKKHMWPLTVIPPRYLESWVVCFIDTYCTVKEYIIILKNAYEE